MVKTKIEWATDVWNPIRGCSRVSEGCRHCYAERQAWRIGRMANARGTANPYRGLVTFKVSAPNGPRWTGEVRLVQDAVTLPLRWRKPRRIFLDSMSDLFHEKVEDEWIDRIFAVMALAPRHTFQVLTKRADRMRAYFADMTVIAARVSAQMATLHPDPTFRHSPIVRFGNASAWPLPNVWLGVSVENQTAAGERIPLLLQTPAAVRFVSYEPALAPIAFVSQWHDWLTGWTCEPEPDRDGNPVPVQVQTEKLDWLIVGGESGPGARPCDLAWLRSVVAQCQAARVPCFVKQLGAQPCGSLKPSDVSFGTAVIWKFCDRKGGDPSEWPADLRVREFPGVAP